MSRAIFGFLLFFLWQAASGSALPLPMEMEKLILGTWKEEVSVEGLVIKGEATYKPDFTVEHVGTVTSPQEVIHIRAKAKWRIEGNVLISEVTESKHAELVGEIERDTILAMDSSQWVYRDGDGVVVTAVRVTKHGPVSATTDASKETLQALVSAVGFEVKYQRMAGVLAKFYAKRGQGDDVKSAKIFSKIDASNLTSAVPCMVNVYQRQAFTEAEARQLTAFLTSRLGRKWAEESERAHHASLEAQSPVSLNVSAFSVDEHRELVNVYQTPEFIKYGKMTVDPETRAAMIACVNHAAGIAAADLY